MENQEINLTLTVKEINQILAVIGQQKLADVIELFNKIRDQSMSQLTPKTEE